MTILPFLCHQATGKESRGSCFFLFTSLFSLSSLYLLFVRLSLLSFRLIVLHSLLPPITYIHATRTPMMARAKRSAPNLAVVEAPKQEGRSRRAYVRLMVVTTPPSTAPTEQTKVTTGRNEGTILQDDKGKISFTTSDIRLTTQLGYWTILNPTKSMWRRGLQEMGTSKANKGARRRRDL